ncbi:hypothetical protein TNCV_3837611 [Trichonephila clavipes]|nr:hypothetical protein TNCV_3837611 [Trichonephila clavipes]
MWGGGLQTGRPGFDAHQIPSEYTRNTCSLNQRVRKSCGRLQLKPRVQRTGEYPSSCSMPKLWRWRSVVPPSIVKKSNLSHKLWQHSFLPLGSFTELNRTVTCMVFKTKANDRRTSSPLRR